VSRQSVNVGDWEGAAGSVHRCAWVVTRGQQRRKEANESEQGLFSPPGSSPTMQDTVTENPVRPRGGAVADPSGNSGRAAGPPLGNASNPVWPLPEGVGWSTEELQKFQADDRDIGQVVFWMQQGQRITLPFSHFCLSVVIIIIINRIHQGVRCPCSVLFHPFIGINHLIGLY